MREGLMDVSNAPQKKHPPPFIGRDHQKHSIQLVDTKAMWLTLWGVGGIKDWNDLAVIP